MNMKKCIIYCKTVCLQTDARTRGASLIQIPLRIRSPVPVTIFIVPAEHACRGRRPYTFLSFFLRSILQAYYKSARCCSSSIPRDSRKSRSRFMTYTFNKFNIRCGCYYYTSADEIANAVCLYRYIYILYFYSYTFL